MIQLSSKGEVGDFQEADQFPTGKSQFECGYFACAMAKSMAAVGKPPTLSLAQVISDAESWYAQYDGTDAISNTNGMSLPQLYSLLQQIGLHYQALSTDINVVKSWIKAGYPVLIALTEVSVDDMVVGGNPYPWNAGGTHVILVTGVASDGNVLVRDSANCTNLYDPNSLRPGPRKYNAAKLQLVSATVAVPPWMPRPTSATAPIGGSNMPTPTGWKDDGKTLTAPNGVPVVLGFRGEITNASEWDAADVPLAPQFHTSQVQVHNTSLGEGDVLITKDHVLWYTVKKGVVNEPQLGSEIKSCYEMIASQQAQIATLKAATPVPTPSTPVDTAAIIAALKTLQTYNDTAIEAALKTLGAS